MTAIRAASPKAALSPIPAFTPVERLGWLLESGTEAGGVRGFIVGVAVVVMVVMPAAFVERAGARRADGWLFVWELVADDSEEDEGSERGESEVDGTLRALKDCTRAEELDDVKVIVNVFIDERTRLEELGFMEVVLDVFVVEDEGGTMRTLHRTRLDCL